MAGNRAIEQLRKQYLKDADLMGSKQRFGFFSIPPSNTLGVTEDGSAQYKVSAFKNKTPSTGNLYSGRCSTGKLKNDYFSSPESIYKGDPYQPPSFWNRFSKTSNKKCTDDRQTFKTASINKTLCTASYPYISDAGVAKQPKEYRNEDGSVRISSPKICTNPSSTISYKTFNKTFRHSSSPYDEMSEHVKKQNKQNINKRIGEGAFKRGGAIRQFFSPNKDTFYDIDMKKPGAHNRSRNQSTHVVHEHAFIPSSSKTDKQFSYPKTTEKILKMRKCDSQMRKSRNSESEQAFRLPNKKQSSRPSSSISCNRMNLMRKMR